MKISLPHVRQPVWLSLYAALLSVVVLTYFQNYPIPEFLPKISSLFLFVLFFCSAISFGSILLKLLTNNKTASLSLTTNNNWYLIFSYGLGIGALSTAILLISFVPFFSIQQRVLFLGLFLILLLLKSLKKESIRVFNGLFSSTSNLKLTELILLFFVGTGMLIAFVSCFSPITYYDSLGYHLSLPAQYLQANKIFNVSTNLYSYFPAAQEMVYMFFMTLMNKPDFLINLFCWSLAVATGWGIYSWAKEIYNRHLGIWALFIWWTMPAVLLLSIGAYVDIGLSFFIFLSVRCFWIAKKKSWNQRWLVASAIFSSLACSVKYTGILCPFILLVILLWCHRSKTKSLFQRLGLFSVTLLLPFGLWLLKNYVYIGNPVFPFLTGVIGSDLGWPAEIADQYFNVLLEYGKTSTLFVDLIKSPWSITLDAQSFGGGFDVLGDFGWPLILFSVPLIWTSKIKNKGIGFLMVFFVSFFVLWFISKPVLRFLIAVLPIGVLIAAVSIQKLSSHKSNIVRYLTLLFVIPWIISNGFLYFFISAEFQPFSPAIGIERGEDFLKRKLLYYSTFDFANKNLDRSNKVLVLGEQRTYHLKIPYVSSNFFAPSPAAGWFNQDSKNLLEIGAKIKSKEITHILVNGAEIKRMGGLDSLGFSKAGALKLKQYISDNTHALKSQNGTTLYSIFH